MGFEVWGLGFEVLGPGFEVLGLGFDELGLGFEVWGLGFGKIDGPYFGDTHPPLGRCENAFLTINAIFYDVFGRVAGRGVSREG